MRVTVLLLVVLVVFAAFTEAGKKNKKGGKNRGGRRGRNPQRDKTGRDCTPWVWGDCIPTEGECGAGTKKATRDGAGCKVISKTKRCRIPCEGDRRRKACKYDHGQWGLCDTLTNTRVRLDTLIEETSDTTTCAPERVVVKKCSFACKYAFEDWGECDETTRTRSREGVLTRKKGETPADCDETILQTKNCYNKKGNEKCFFGPWDKYGKCIDGKRTKTRPLFAGGPRCQRKATKTKNCKAKQI
ncbi:midkine-like isoform X2 [Ptychodera flava]|uniref:midkine-like isoform X2 n=1 Tax=Ptychodera flava TaxID=63121 RepID=UPI003969C02B